jgi:hypothetical protein
MKIKCHALPDFHHPQITIIRTMLEAASGGHLQKPAALLLFRIP